MFDPEKMQATLDAVRNQATELRGRENFEGINIRLVEFILLQTFADLNTCMRTLETLAQERDQLKVIVAELEGLKTNKVPEEL